MTTIIRTPWADSDTPQKCLGDEKNGDKCGAVEQRCSVKSPENCAVTVLDHFTSSFHWAEGNVSAIWLRPQWYLLTNSVISDCTAARF